MLLLRFKEAVLQLEVEIPDHASEYQAHLSPSVVIGLSEKLHRLVGKAYPISIPIQFRGPIENDWTISPLSGANVASPHLSDRQVSGSLKLSGEAMSSQNHPHILPFEQEPSI